MLIKLRRGSWVLAHITERHRQLKMKHDIREKSVDTYGSNRNRSMCVYQKHTIEKPP